MRRRPSCSTPRRKALVAAAAVVPLCLALPAVVRAAPARSLSFYHLHTHETLEVTYFADGEYLPEALARIDRLLRDFRTGEMAPTDPALLDMLHRVAQVCGASTFEVISAYRSPATNATLADKSAAVSRNSLHLQGRAIDVRLQGYDTGRLRDVCAALALGGVGYYPESNFVHLDTGRVRAWGPASG
jgi:uncharacterized protein YcbK (DUF882 family)